MKFTCVWSIQWWRIKPLTTNVVMITQDSIKEKMPAAEAEKLLRIALFSDSLRLSHKEDKVLPDDVTPSLKVSSKLVLKRQALAQSLRENRKKGVVPVFVSLSKSSSQFLPSRSVQCFKSSDRLLDR